MVPWKEARRDRSDDHSDNPGVQTDGLHVVPTCVAVGSREADLAVAGVSVDAVHTHAELTGVAQALVVV